MRTIGEILKKGRIEKKLAYEDIERQLRIRKKFLIALEENDWDRLPSLPYIKGFIKNYSTFLGLNADEMLAVFRRQFSLSQKDGLLPEGISKPLNVPFVRFTPQTIILITLLSFIILLFTYLFFQYQAFTGPPNLTISKPQEGEIVSSEEVQIVGKTDPDAVVSINNQKIAVAQNGEFSLKLTLSPDTNTIVIEATSKYGKKKTVKRTIQVQPTS